MAKRQYNQLCPLAYALDVLGERWTLLIVRDLVFGPRRYTDLLNGLQGIGTNLLASRLKALEEAHVIVQRQLPPPAASTVYELTEHGKGLIPIIQSMARWGMSYMQMPPPSDHYLGTVSAMNALTMMFSETKAAGITSTCEIHGNDEIFHAIVQDSELQVIAGAAHKPDVSIAVEYKSLLSVLTGMMPRQVIQDSGGIIIKNGSEAALDQFVTAFGFG